MRDNSLTTIQVKKATLELLKERKIYSRESYNEMILRLLEVTK